MDSRQKTVLATSLPTAPQPISGREAPRPTRPILRREPFMKAPLHILHLEDNPMDSTLIHTMLRAEGVACQITRVQTRAEFETALEQDDFDMIVSDFSLPSFDGQTALQIAHSKYPDVPFIFVSGTIGEEAAVESLKQGATDYVLKDRLSRLVPALKRAAREAAERSARRQAEEQLQRRNELFRQITENVDDLIAVLDLEGKSVFKNPSYERLFGSGPSLLGKDWFEEIHPEDRAAMRELFRQTLAVGVGRRAEFRLLLQGGTTRFIESQWSVIRDDQRNIVDVVVVSRDVTERRQAEERSREQAALLDKAQDAICVMDMQQAILYWNKGAERLYGWTDREAVGRNTEDLLLARDLTRPREVLKSLIQKGKWQGELHQVTKTKEEIMVESRWTLMRDVDEKPKSILVINTDITERKRLEAQFLRTQRMECIGTLAGGIAHDLNNVLAPILMSGDLLRDEPFSQEARRILDTVHTSARRGSEMVKQILSFARGAGGEPAVLHLKQLVTEVENLLKETFPRSITIRTQIAPDLRRIIGNATQLHQVLMNLCVNGRDAMPEGGSLRIGACNVVLDELYAATHPRVTAGPYVLLSVSDTGIGIPAHLLERIFDPFFTTKEEGKGTGLGLSTVLNIVKSHDGFVEVSSRTGRGTTFNVYLPAPPTADTACAKQRPASPPIGRGEQILVVDDETAILEITRLTLESFNYRVLTAKDGAQAVPLYQQRAAEIDLVITDMMMPTMDGPALIRALSKINPGVRIIGVSGMGPSPKLAEGDKSSVRAFLTKPFTAQELARAVLTVLKAP